MISIIIFDKIAQAASIQAKLFNRSLDGQIEHWAEIGKIAEENPELSFAFIKEVLIVREEALAGETKSYLFDDARII